MWRTNWIVVTSKNNLLVEEVEYLANQSAIQEADYNQKYGVVSVCVMIMRPTVDCVSKICKY